MVNNKINLPVWSNLPPRIKTALDTLTEKIEQYYCFESELIKDEIDKATWFNTPTLIKNVTEALINYQYPTDIDRPSWTYLPDNVNKLEKLVEQFSCFKRVFTEAPTVPVVNVVETGDHSITFNATNVERTSRMYFIVYQTTPFKKLGEEYIALKDGINYTLDNSNSMRFIKQGSQVGISLYASNNQGMEVSNTVYAWTTGTSNTDAIDVSYAVPSEGTLCNLTGLKLSQFSKYRLYFADTTNVQLPVVGATLYEDLELTTPHTSETGLKLRGNNKDGAMYYFTVDANGVVTAVGTSCI